MHEESNDIISLNNAMMMFSMCLQGMIWRRINPVIDRTMVEFKEAVACHEKSSKIDEQSS